MASCRRVAASGDYSVKQKGGEKRLMRRWQLAAPEACVLQAAMVQLGGAGLTRVQVVLSLSLWSGRGNGIWRKYHIKSEFLKNRLL